MIPQKAASYGSDAHGRKYQRAYNKTTWTRLTNLMAARPWILQLQTPPTRTPAHQPTYSTSSAPPHVSLTRRTIPRTVWEDVWIPDAAFLKFQWHGVQLGIPGRLYGRHEDYMPDMCNMRKYYLYHQRQGTAFVVLPESLHAHMR